MIDSDKRDSRSRGEIEWDFVIFCGKRSFSVINKVEEITGVRVSVLVVKSWRQSPTEPCAYLYVVLKRSNVIILMLDTCNNCFFLCPFFYFLSEIFIHYCFFFSDIQIKEVDFKSQVLFFHFIFQQYFDYTFYPGTLHIKLTLFLLKIHKFSLFSRVVSTRKVFSVCWTFDEKPF